MVMTVEQTLGELIVEPNREDLAYAGGLFDGEGCVMLTKLSVNGYTRLVVTVMNTNPIVSGWLTSIFGGRVYKHPTKNPMHKVGYNWRLDSYSASEFLSIILPYLKLKDKQAEIAIKFQSTQHRNSPYTLEELGYRDYLYEEMKMLNQRGNIDDSAGGTDI